MLMWMVVAAAVEAAPMPAFLAGCWEEKRAEQIWTEECWTSGRGGLMMGSGRNGKGDTVGRWEWMRIERGADGALTFYASPKGAKPVAFKATAADADSITFVNSAHDFPQRVHYQRTANGLDAEISLSDGKKPVRWTYRRTGSATKD
jgi:hypothetical protein